jgi:hypothetical protein
MNHLATLIAVTLLGLGATHDAAARTYKCTKNGVTVYQGMPCDPQPAAASTNAKGEAKESALLGCYELPDRSPVRGANQPLIVRKQIASEAGRVTILDGHTKKTAVMRPATPEELQSANARFQAKIEEGLVLAETDGKPSPLPGLYRAGDRFYGSFATGSAPATRLDCSAW